VGVVDQVGQPALRHDYLPGGVAQAQHRCYFLRAGRQQQRPGFQGGVFQVAAPAPGELGAGQHALRAEGFDQLREYVNHPLLSFWL